MKTNELSGVDLDWAVAKCEVGEDISEIDDPHFYSTDWAQGGPIIEREGITTAPHSTHNGVIREWKAGRDWPMSHSPFHFGTTPLIAAMRCYVASVLGDEVELPSVVEKIGL